MQRKASAIWQGGLKDGKGSLSTDSGVLRQTPYSFSTRFEDGVGTNPEELLGAAHAACFAMALSGALGKAGLQPEYVDARAEVTVSPKPEGGFKVTRSHLICEAKVPGASAADFAKHAEGAKAGCPISGALGGVEITLDAKLVPA